MIPGRILFPFAIYCPRAAPTTTWSIVQCNPSNLGPDARIDNNKLSTDNIHNIVEPPQLKELILLVLPWQRITNQHRVINQRVTGTDSCRSQGQGHLRRLVGDEKDGRKRICRLMSKFDWSLITIKVVCSTKAKFDKSGNLTLLCLHHYNTLSGKG